MNFLGYSLSLSGDSLVMKPFEAWDLLEKNIKAGRPRKKNPTHHKGSGQKHPCPTWPLKRK